ncbi:MAG: DUF4956 domain-containing protein [Oscillospiraceae bacterium]
MLNQTLTTNFSAGEIILCGAASIVLGAMIAAAFGYKSRKSGSYMITVALLPLIVQVIIMLVNGNVGTGIAVMGAFGLVRFRSAQGSAIDICGVFLAMAVGLACGTGHIWIAAGLAAVVCLLKLLYTILPIGKNKPKEKELHITIPENLEYDGVFKDILDKYTKKWELVQVKTTNMGSLFKLKYYIEIIDPSDEKKLIDELRCRNGNLEIMCSQISVNDEQALF